MNSAVIEQPISLTAAGSSALRVEVVSDYRTLLGMQATWDELVLESAGAYPFRSHAWFRAWWECFGADNGLHVVTVYAGTNLIGIAPLMSSSKSVYGVTLRRLSFLENDHTPRCDFILRRDMEQQASGAIWDFLRSEPQWDLLELNHLPTGCVTLEYLTAVARADGYLAGTRDQDQSPYVPLVGDWENYFKQLHYNHRRNVRKKMNRLKRCGRVELEVISDTEILTQALDDGFRIEAAAWKEQNHTAMRSDPAVRRFYESYAQHAGRAGTLRLTFLKIDGKRIAFKYALHDYNRLYVLKAGYEVEYARHSPSHILCNLMMQDSFARGLVEYDFLGNNEAWKLEWNPQIRPHYGLLVFRRTWRTRALYALKCQVMPILQRQPLYLRLRDAVLGRRRGRRAFMSTESRADEDESA